MRKLVFGITTLVTAGMIFTACGNSSSTAMDNMQETSSVVSEISEQVEEVQESKVAGGVYTYMNDKWDIYRASFLSDTTVKIENWGRYNAGPEGDPFEFDYDVKIIKIEDEANSFAWLDDSCTAFKITMIDEECSYWEEEKEVIFTIQNDDAITLGSGITDTNISYTYMNDKFNVYRAIPVSDTIIKVEKWYRGVAGEEAVPFSLDYDFTVIDTMDAANDFKWSDEDHTSFTLNLWDEENSYWEEEKEVPFTICNPGAVELGSAQTSDNTVYTYQNDKWNMYKAVALSATVVKIENWHRTIAGEDGTPYEVEYDVCVINTENGSTDFEWLDEEHSSFTITMQDTANSYWEDEKLVAFSVEG